MKPQADSTTEVLAGLVERVTFHSQETGFCVLRVKARGHRDLVTTVGHAAMISAGEWITASGIWLNDRNHGLQFKAHFLKTSAPSTIEGIEKYLGSGMIRGIGPVHVMNCQSLLVMTLIGSRMSFCARLMFPFRARLWGQNTYQFSSMKWVQIL